MGRECGQENEEGVVTRLDDELNGQPGEHVGEVVLGVGPKPDDVTVNVEVVVVGPLLRVPPERRPEIPAGRQLVIAAVSVERLADVSRAVAGAL